MLEIGSEMLNTNAIVKTHFQHVHIILLETKAFDITVLCINFYVMNDILDALVIFVLCYHTSL